MRAAIISLGSKSSIMTADAMKSYFDVVDLIDIRKIEISVGSGATGILCNGKLMESYDCVVIKGSFKYAAIQRAIASRLIGKCYMPYDPKAFSVVHDKLLTHLELENSKIPMPTTYLSSSPKGAKELLKTIKYPIIMKIPHGTQGKGVMFADSYAAATSILDTLDSLKQPFLIQEYVETGGTDIRVFVVGDKVVACMKRKSSGEDKRSNLHAGGGALAFTSDSKINKIAISTSKALGAEICGVDILEGMKSPLVIEANLSPGLQGITDATGIDISDKIAKHLALKTQEFLIEKNKHSTVSNLLNDEGITQIAEKEKKEPQNVITNLDFRGDRILLPKLVSIASKFNEEEDYYIEFRNGEIKIKKV